MPVDDLLPVYIALKRSVLEYCALVWHTVTPEYLSNELKRVPIRGMRILYPESCYNEALSPSGCSLLSKRRFHLCIKTFNKISKPQYRINYLAPETRASVPASSCVIVSLCLFQNVEPKVKRAVFSPQCATNFI